MIVEGFALKFSGIIWTVKGCYHPPGGAIAMPRLTPSRKIKTLGEAMDFVRINFRELLRYVPEVGTEVPVIPLEEAEVLDPFKVPKPARVKPLLIRFKNVGITGSWLYGGETPSSDVDLLSFDESNYETLIRLREEGESLALRSYSEAEVEILKQDDFAKLKTLRVLEGEMNGIPYTFKIVKCLDLGRVEGQWSFIGKVKVIRAVRPFTIPCVYEAESDQGRLIMTSFRIRFTEIPEGTEMEVKGLVQERGFLNLNLDLSQSVRIIEIGQRMPWRRSTGL